MSPEIVEVYYVPWRCRCCGRMNQSNDPCDCSRGGLRSDPMDMSAVRLCSVCSKCSVHCPHNHTSGASSGWETTAVQLRAHRGW